MLIRAHIYEENMQPFDMATATNKRSGQTVIADLNGIVELAANPDDDIRIEAMGYEPEEYKAKYLPPSIIMKPSIQTLGTVELTYKKKTNWFKRIAIAALIALTIKKYVNEQNNRHKRNR